MQPQHTRQTARARVLIVDDDQSVTETLAQVLASDSVASRERGKGGLQGSPSPQSDIYWPLSVGRNDRLDAAAA
jgi:response regulator RpfG family c-di-GMP phosphodiesterase